MHCLTRTPWWLIGCPCCAKELCMKCVHRKSSPANLSDKPFFGQFVDISEVGSVVLIQALRVVCSTKVKWRTHVEEYMILCRRQGWAWHILRGASHANYCFPSSSLLMVGRGDDFSQSSSHLMTKQKWLLSCRQQHCKVCTGTWLYAATSWYSVNVRSPRQWQAYMTFRPILENGGCLAWQILGVNLEDLL